MKSRLLNSFSLSLDYLLNLEIYSLNIFMFYALLLKMGVVLLFPSDVYIWCSVFAFASILAADNQLESDYYFKKGRDSNETKR